MEVFEIDHLENGNFTHSGTNIVEPSELISEDIFITNIYSS